MSMTATPQAEPTPPRPAVLRRGARVVGWVLLACWSVVLLCACFLGQGASNLSQLEAEVSTGRVHSVGVAGGMAPEGRGFAVVEVHWRSGWFAYSTEVVEARPRKAARRAGAREDVTGVISGDLGERLQRLQPGLRVEHVTRQTGPSTDVLGRTMTGWPVWLLYLAFLSTVLLLVLGPEPWRATRWAWFWLLTSAGFPLTAVAYLVLAGPTSLVSAPRKGTRRLTGGWAFLIASVISTALGAGR